MGEYEQSVNYVTFRAHLKHALQQNSPDVHAIIKSYRNSFDHRSQDVTYSSHSKFTNEEKQYLDLFDALLTVPADAFEGHILFSLIKEELLPSTVPQLSEHHANVLEMLDKKRDIFQIVPSYVRHETKYEKLKDLYEQFQSHLVERSTSTLNSEYETRNVFLLIREICDQFRNDVKPVTYVQRVLNYLKMLSKLASLPDSRNVTIDPRRFDTFKMLDVSHTSLVKELVYVKMVSVPTLHSVFTALVLDLTYPLAACSFPLIEFGASFKSNVVETIRKPTKDASHYIRGKNWLLGTVLDNVHGFENKFEDAEHRVDILNRTVFLEDVQNTKLLFEGNDVVAMLLRDSIRSFDDIDCTKYSSREVYDAICSVPEIQIRQNPKMLSFRDTIICAMIREGAGGDCTHVQFISDPSLRVNMILKYFRNWSAKFCLELIKSELTRFDVNGDEFEDVLVRCGDKMNFYVQVQDLLSIASPWDEIEERCRVDPASMLTQLSTLKNIDIVIDFVNVQRQPGNVTVLLDDCYFAELFRSNFPTGKIKKLLGTLPAAQMETVCYSLIRKLQNVDDLEFVVEILLERETKYDEDLGNVKIVLKMLRCFPECEQKQFWKLVDAPLSIIEMLLMNVKLDKLAQVLRAVKSEVEELNRDEEVSFPERVDTLLRQYAEKSVDFKLIVHREEARREEVMISIESLHLVDKSFVMPEQAPEIADWVCDNDVSTSSMPPF